MSEPDDPKKWRAHSVLKYTFRKSDHLKALRCVALHEAYDTKSKEFQTQLDIQCERFTLINHKFAVSTLVAKSCVLTNLTVKLSWMYIF